MGMAVIDEIYKQTDLVISNLPGPYGKITVNGKNIKDIGCFANLPEKIKLFIIPMSFNGKFRFCMVSRENLKWDTQGLIDNLAKNLNDDITANS